MVMTVPNAQSFVCLFEYKRERVYAIGAVDLPVSILQQSPCHWTVD